MNRWAAIARRTGYGALIVVVVVWLASLVAVVVWSRRDGARPADAIVVLGAAQYVGRPSPVLRARLDHAIALWNEGFAKTLVLTGGRGAGDTTSEAEVGRAYVMKRGIPYGAVMLESEGRTTSESLHAVAALMLSREMPRAILVSDPFHMLRLRILAGRFGLTPYTSPTPTSPISANRSQAWKYVLSESVKVPLAFLLERYGPAGDTSPRPPDTATDGASPSPDQ